MNGCIYMYVIDNGMKYIGQTIRPLEVRHREHLKYNNQVVDRMIRTHSYKLDVLWEGPENELDYAEQYFINKFNTLYPNGLNFNSGGMSNRYPSEETKRKMSENHRSKRGYTPYWLGKKRSKETCAKISESNKGKPGYLKTHKVTDETRNKMSIAQKKPVYMCDKATGDILSEFPSANDASIILGINQHNISSCCNGIKYRKTAGGYTWRFKE